MSPTAAVGTGTVIRSNGAGAFQETRVTACGTAGVLNRAMRRTRNAEQPASLLGLAAATIVRTMLSFTVPYLLAYYCVMSAWDTSRPLLALLVRIP